MIQPGVYKKGNRTRYCFGQEGFYVYYTTPSQRKSMTGERVELFEKWAKGATYYRNTAEASVGGKKID